MDMLKQKENGSVFWEILRDDWSIFSGVHAQEEQLVRAILNDLSDEVGPPRELEVWLEPVRDWGGSKPKDVDLNALWDEFSGELRSENRFFSKKAIEIGIFVRLFQKLEFKIEKGAKLFRARNSYEQNRKFNPDEMGKPPAEKTKNGRANPIGISYLYLASNQKTAIAEIRPSLADPVTVAEFESMEDMTLIDLRDVSPFQFVDDEDFDNLIVDIGFLIKLGNDLSRPINPRDAGLAYLPTQYLCEMIKSEGWDGVVYRSSLAGGYNVALFSDAKVRIARTDFFKITKTDLEYVPA